MPFKVSVSCEDMDDSFYFENLPPKITLIRSIRRNQGIADECWSSYYDRIIHQLNLMNDYPESFSSRLAHQGIPLKDACSVGFTQFKFEVI